MKSLKKRPGRRNAIASTLANPSFRKQIVKPKTGRGSFRRQPKHRLAGGGLPSGPVSTNEIATATR